MIDAIFNASTVSMGIGGHNFPEVSSCNYLTLSSTDSSGIGDVQRSHQEVSDFPECLVRAEKGLGKGDEVERQASHFCRVHRAFMGPNGNEPAINSTRTILEPQDIMDGWAGDKSSLKCESHGTCWSRRGFGSGVTKKKQPVCFL